MDRRRAFNSIFFPSFISSTFSFNEDLFRLSRFLSQFFFPIIFLSQFFSVNVIAAEISFRPQRENKKTEAAITSSNMKYKIQNHFAHNGVQVFLHQKCAFPYFILPVKQENTNAECEKKKQQQQRTHTLTHSLPQNFHLQPSTELQWVAKVCRTQTVCWLSTRN